MESNSVQICENKRKFCVAVNIILHYCNQIAEECLVHIIDKQCLPILAYGAGVWCVKNEVIRKTGVTFNTAFRKIFNYKQYESVRDILFGFGLLPFDIYIKRARLLLLNAALLSNRSVVRMCAEWCVNENKTVEYMHDMNIDSFCGMAKLKIIETCWVVFKSTRVWT